MRIFSSEVFEGFIQLHDLNSAVQRFLTDNELKPISIALTPYMVSKGWSAILIYEEVES